MTRFGTDPQMVRLRRSSDNQVFVRIAPAASFLSQMIAERRLPAHADAAIGAYAAGSRIAVRRLPAGYTTTRVV
jgi:hypothetical protein